MRRRSGGFTLTELIIVIVITAIVATISVQFVRFSVQGALDTASRQRLAQAGAIISDKVGLALRNALPGSVRVLDGGRCVEIMPVLAASLYQSIPLDESDVFMAVAESSALPNGRIAVYPIAGPNLYASPSPSPGILSGTVTVPADDGDGLVEVDLSGHRFLAHSPERRFFVVGSPITFCQQGTFLYRYSGYAATGSPTSHLAALGTMTYPDREVIAASLQADSVDFRFSAPTLTRNGVVEFDVMLQDPDSGEALALSQEVQIRNVP